MGVIKDGSISGVLPSSSEVFAVHYPGYPSSFERATETLGGSEGILKVRSSKSNNLELRFRPEDPYSHPTSGKLQPCNNFLLKISKKKVQDEQKTNGPNPISEHVTKDDSPHIRQDSLREDSQQITQEQLSADIVARVPEAYYFNGMVDYQHVLPVHAEVNRRKKRNWAEVEPQFGQDLFIDVDQEDLMILVPPLFTNKDRPEQLVLKPSIDASIKKKREGVVLRHGEMEVERCLGIDFNIKVVPKKVNWEKSIPSNSDEWQWQKAVCELFDERPIWVKNSLVERLLDSGLNLGNKTLQRLLFIAAYYFSNGPFLRFYIRKGYDPRTDPESRVYQRTDFRVPPSLRSYCDKNIASGMTNRWEDICAFRVFPYKCHTSFQLFELKDDYVQQEISKPPSQGSCHLQTGWFSSQVIDCMRLRVAQRFLSAYPETGAESLLKSVAKRFEKSKTAHISVKDLKLVEDKEANKEVLETEEKENNDDKAAEYEEEDEEEEIEDDNLGEDDVEADEDLDLVDGDANSPLRSDSYTDHENFSKDYLQDLFGSFPFNAAGTGGDETQKANADSDDEGEYQIYEQYSDIDYTDDDVGDDHDED